MININSITSNKLSNIITIVFEWVVGGLMKNGLDTIDKDLMKVTSVRDIYF